MYCSGFPAGHFHSIFLPSPGRTGARESQRPWTQTSPTDDFPFISGPRPWLLSQAWNSRSAGVGEGACPPGCRCQRLLGIQSVRRGRSPPQAGQLAEPGEHLPDAGPPAQTAVDCLMLWKLTRVGEVGMDMARATRARIECLSCHRRHLFRMAERTCEGAEQSTLREPGSQHPLPFPRARTSGGTGTARRCAVRRCEAHRGQRRRRGPASS